MTLEESTENNKSVLLNYKGDILPALQNLRPNIPVAQFMQFIDYQQGMPKVYVESSGKIRIVHSRKGSEVELITSTPLEEWEIAVIPLRDKNYQFPTPMLMRSPDH